MASFSRGGDAATLAGSARVQKAKLALEEAKKKNGLRNEIRGNTIGGNPQRLREMLTTLQTERDEARSEAELAEAELKISITNDLIAYRDGRTPEPDYVRDAERELQEAEKAARMAGATARGGRSSDYVTPAGSRGRGGGSSSNDKWDRVREGWPEPGNVRCEGAQHIVPARGGLETDNFARHVLRTSENGLIKKEGFAGRPRDALRVVQTWGTWAEAMGPQAPARSEDALKNLPCPVIVAAVQRIYGSETIVGATGDAVKAEQRSVPWHVLDGTSLFNRNKWKWDWKDRILSAHNERAQDARTDSSLAEHGPVVIVMQHQILDEEILHDRTNRLTDVNLKQLDYILCPLHGGIYPVVIVDIHLVGCNREQFTTAGGAALSRPCFQNNPGLPLMRNGAPVIDSKTTKPLTESRCRTMTDGDGDGKGQTHGVCEYDDVVADLIAAHVHFHEEWDTIIVTDDRDGHIDKKRQSSWDNIYNALRTRSAHWNDIWTAMNELGDRARVRLYELVHRTPPEDVPEDIDMVEGG